MTHHNKVIALDAMGGDGAPDIVLEGAAIARERYPKIRYIFFGDEARITPLLKKHSALQDISTIHHTPDMIPGDMKPSLALRQGRNSSMRLALNAVSEGVASSIVSAGNTGALMVLAKFVLKTLPEIDRPAIAGLMPTQVGESVMLDLGANVECDAENLVQFAMIGSIFCKTILGITNPTIGLLNIGTEELKGHDEIRAAANILQERGSFGKFHGFIEGNDIAKGTVDVIVSDGFSGNIALKTLEGTASLFTHFLRQSIGHSPMAKIGYLFLRGAMKRLKLRADPRRYNGAMLLGLQGVCVKSHGGTDAIGFANAIGVAYNLVDKDFNAQIAAELIKHYNSPATMADKA